MSRLRVVALTRLISKRQTNKSMEKCVMRPKVYLEFLMRIEFLGHVHGMMPP